MPEFERMSVVDTAKFLHKSQQWVRLGLQSKQLDFGSAVQLPTGHWSYHIIKSKVYEYAGVAYRKDDNTNEKAVV